MKLKNFIILFIKGMIIGVALIIPGLSAGTMVLITGLYVSLIQFFSSFKLNTIFQKNMWSHFISYFIYLIPFFLGCIVGGYAVIDWMSELIRNYKVLTYCIFSGVILASIPFLFRQMRIDGRSILFFILSTVVTFCISFLNVEVVEGSFFSGYFWHFLSVYLAVGAMLLPGVSGSYILIIMGTYSHIIEYVQSLSWFVLGYAMVGLLSVWTVSKWIRYLLKSYQFSTMACLTGMTLGGGIGIFPLKEKSQWIEQGGIGILFFLIGVVAVFLIHSITSMYLSRNK